MIVEIKEVAKLQNYCPGNIIYFGGQAYYRGIKRFMLNREPHQCWPVYAGSEQWLRCNKCGKLIQLQELIDNRF